MLITLVSIDVGKGLSSVRHQAIITWINLDSVNSIPENKLYWHMNKIKNTFFFQQNAFRNIVWKYGHMLTQINLNLTFTVNEGRYVQCLEVCIMLEYIDTIMQAPIGIKTGIFISKLGG